MNALRLLRSLLIQLALVLCLFSTQALAQTPEVFVGVWNGFNRHSVVAEISNRSDQEAQLTFDVDTSAGIDLGSELVVVPAQGMVHVSLDKYGIVDNHGTYTITAASSHKGGELKINGISTFYRYAPQGSSKAVEYAFAIPWLKNLQGVSGGIFNSFNAAGGVNPVYNWLTVYLPPTSTEAFSATVEVYNQAGEFQPAQTFRVSGLQPGARLDFPLGHEQGQVVGLYRIIPDDVSADYGSFLSRYSLKNDGSFQFAFSLTALEGSCDQAEVPASTMDPATNWGEVGNLGGKAIEIVTEVRDQATTLLGTETRTVQPFSQEHFYLNANLGPRNIGTFSVRCVDPQPEDKIVVQSLFYGHLNAASIPQLEWAYASQALGASRGLGAKVYAPVNTFIDAFNWLKSQNSAVQATAFGLEVFDRDGKSVSQSGNNVLGTGGNRDIPIHELVGPNFIGTLNQEISSEEGALATELIRVFPHTAGGIGYIMNVPTFREGGESGQGGSSSSSSSSSSTSSSSSSSSSSTSSSSSSTSSSSSSTSSSSSSGMSSGGPDLYSLRINAGGTANTTDSGGRVWLTDQSFTGGSNDTPSLVDIAGTVDDFIYQTDRFADPQVLSGTLSYSIPVNASIQEYLVTLHFAEIFHTASGTRVFDVLAEGKLFVDDADILFEAGASHEKMTRTFAVEVSDGVLDLVFLSNGVDNAKISGIEIVEKAQQVAPPLLRAAPKSANFGVQQIGSAASSTEFSVDNVIPGATGAFKEENGIVVVDLESEDVVPDWQLKNSISGAKGSGYFEWGGSNFFNSPGNSVLTYQVEIETPGNYELRWRSRIAVGSSNSEHNDSWVQFPTGVNVSGEEPLSGQWTKVYTNQLGKWSWVSLTADEQTAPVRQFFEAGVHEVKISGRSMGHAIDRFVLFKYDSVSYNESAFNALVESSRSTGFNGGVGVQDLVISNISVQGPAAADFAYSGPLGFPLTVLPGDSLDISADFSATALGQRNAVLVIESNGENSPQVLPLSGFGADIGSLPIRINAGETDPLSDLNGNPWLPDQFFATPTNVYSDNEDIAGIDAATSFADGDQDPSNNPNVYQTERWANQAQGQVLSYDIPVPSAGDYFVTLHFSEIFNDEIGQRVIDVTAEGLPVVNSLDMVGQVGSFAALKRSFVVNVADNQLDLDFSASADNPKISAIEIDAFTGQTILPVLTLSPFSIEFGAVEVGSSSGATVVSLRNDSQAPLTVNALNFVGVEGDQFALSANAPNPPFSIAAGQTQDLEVSFLPTNAGDSRAVLEIISNAAESPTTLPMTGFGQPETGGIQNIVRMNTGGPDYNDVFGEFWIGHQIPEYKVGGVASGAQTGKFGDSADYGGPFEISNTTDDTLYQTYYFSKQVNNGGFNYTRTLANGDYQVTLHFAETFFTQDGQRVFDVAIEGVNVLNDFDVVKEVGPFTATARTFAVTIADGTLNIDFSNEVNNAFLNALEIDRLTEGGTVAFTTEDLVEGGVTPGTNLFARPTTLDYYDGKLFVGQLDGTIHIFTLNAANEVVGSPQVIQAVSQAPTASDDNAPNNCPAANGRLVTGVFVDEVGDLYVSHSDPRIGSDQGFQGTVDPACVDIDSGVLSRLKGPNYNVREDLVIGLPRSRENHAPNGVQVRTVSGRKEVLVSTGGNTNLGGPSVQFGNHPEVNLSAGVLVLNLTAWTSTIDASAGSQVGSTTGDGEIPGLFEVYADGYRNGFDILVHTNGKLYLNDNAGNKNFGLTPGPADGCPNGAAIDPVPSGLDRLPDNLFIVSPGAYGGHPNVARGSCIYADGTAYSPDKPVDSDYTPPIYTYPAVSESTNGLTEYTSLAFGGQLLGDIITVSTFAGSVAEQAVRAIELDATGTQVLSQTAIANNLEGPIDVAVAPDGTIFVAEFGKQFGGNSGSKIKVLRPINPGPAGDNDNDGTPDSSDPDDDNDLYTDADEIANGTNPFNPSSTPSDFDKAIEGGFLVSDLLDPDDDNDGTDDDVDPFFFDASNGDDTVPPLAFEYAPDDDFLGKVANTGFTGVQITSNGTGFIPGLIGAGAAGGFLAIVPTEGSMVGAANDQDNALQLGIDATPTTGLGVFNITARVSDPFKNAAPKGAEGAGIFLGLDQDNFIRLNYTADVGNGSAGVQLLGEIGGTTTTIATVNVPFNPPPSVDLFLQVDPDGGAIQAAYRVNSSNPNDINLLGGTITNGTLGGLANFFTDGLALGVNATRAGESSSDFVGVFDYFRLLPGTMIPSTSGNPQVLIDVDPGGNIVNSSTFIPSSFIIENTSNGGVEVERVRIDMRSAIMRDQVFDPFGDAGDDVGKNFTLDAEPNGGTGKLSHNFLSEHDGGFDVLDIAFNDFQPGESIEFSLDMDPTSIQGSTQQSAGDNGSISGLEMTGANVTVFFSDGSVFTNSLFRKQGSSVGSEAVIEAGVLEAPQITVLNVPVIPGGVSTANHTVQISGPTNTDVRLLLVEGALFVNGTPGGGFDLDPFEANNIVQVISEKTANTGGNGVANINVTFENTVNGGGLNHLIAVFEDSGVKGRTSKTLILELN